MEYAAHNRALHRHAHRYQAGNKKRRRINRSTSSLPVAVAVAVVAVLCHHLILLSTSQSVAPTSIVEGGSAMMMSTFARSICFSSNKRSRASSYPLLRGHHCRHPRDNQGGAADRRRLVDARGSSAATLALAFESARLRSSTIIYPSHRRHHIISSSSTRCTRSHDAFAQTTRWNHRTNLFRGSSCRSAARSSSFFSSVRYQHPRDDDDEIINEEDWKSFTEKLAETLILPAISVPARHVNRLLGDRDSPIGPYLATRMVELEGIHPKIKAVRDDCGRRRNEEDDDGDDDVVVDCDGRSSVRRKRILLHSNLATTTTTTTTTGDDRARAEEDDDDDAPSKDDRDTDDERSSSSSLSELAHQLPGVPAPVLRRLVDDYDAAPGGSETILLRYENQPVSRILSKLLPPEALPPPSSYEQVGHVAHVNLRKHHAPHGKVIGRVMLDRLRPTIRTVVNKLGEVGGPYRTYRTDLLAGDDDYEVDVVEHGASLHFDLRKVYWCTRLEGERTYVIENEFRENQLVADAFCGVGALCIRAALAKGCRVLANDLNPDAARYCKESAVRNGIIDVVSEEGGTTKKNNGRFQVRCGDASQFIMDLGMVESSPSPSSKGRGKSVNSSKEAPVSNLPDHLLLNFPLDSPSFLNALRWWPSGEKIDNPPRVHVYTFARDDEDTDDDDADDEGRRRRTAIDVAIDLVAEGLLPEGGYVKPTKFRKSYLDALGCKVKAREVRDAAPGKMVVCVSFSATRLLLRRMQGDYGLV